MTRRWLDRNRRQFPRNDSMGQFHSPRLLHPLMGANLSTLVQVLSRNGGVAPRYVGHLAIATAATLLRWPFTTYERWQVSRTAAPAAPEPIFIVGHWRSGTTFLYELLSRSPQFAYVSPLATGLPWDFLTLATLLQPLLEKALPQDRFIDQVQVTPDAPQEDEIALASMQPVSFYHGLYFPRHFQRNLEAGLFFDHCTPEQVQRWEWAMTHFCAKLQHQAPQRQLLIKNPVYTGRIAQLRHLWPRAKFIHIYRNPYIVFQSTRNFYQKLLQELALQPFDAAAIDPAILTTYPRLMNSLIHDSAALPNHDFVELRFEAFEADPLAHLEHIYDQLQLDGFQQARPHFMTHLKSRQGYRKNRYSFTAETLAQVQTHWRPFLDRWGYQPPAE